MQLANCINFFLFMLASLSHICTKIGIASANIGGMHTQTLEGVGDSYLAILYKTQKGVELSVVNEGLGGAIVQAYIGRIHK